MSVKSVRASQVSDVRVCVCVCASVVRVCVCVCVRGLCGQADLRDGGLEGVEVDDDEVDGRDLVLRHRRLVLRLAAHTEQRCEEEMSGVYVLRSDE